MSPNPLDSVASLHAELDTALQQVLDTLAGALSGNATTAKAAVDSVANQLRQLIRTVDGALNADMDAIIQRVINELQAASAVSASLLDTVVSQLAPLSPNFSPQTAASQTGQTASATSQGDVAPACIPDFDGTCEEFLAGGWVYSPSVAVNNCPPGPAYSTTTRGGYFSVSSYYAYLARCNPAAVPTAPTGPVAPPIVPTPAPVSPVQPAPTFDTWTILYQCSPWSIRAVPDNDPAAQQALATQGWRYGTRNLAYQSQAQADAYLAANDGAFKSLYCPTMPYVAPVPTTGPTGPLGSPILPPVNPLCPPCPTGPHVDVAPAEGERLPPPANCWDVSVPILPKFDLNLGVNVAPIGSEKWCADQDTLIATFKAVGAFLLTAGDWIIAHDPQLPPTPPDWFTGTVGKIPFGIGKLLCDLYVVNVGIVDNLLRLFRNTFAFGTELVKAVSCGNPNALIALLAIRSLITSLKKVRLGTNLGLWSTLDVEIKWDQAEEVIGYLIKVICPAGIPGVGEAMEARRKDWITPEQYRCWMLMNGHDPEVHDPVYKAHQPVPGISELQRMLWRLRPGAAPFGEQFNDADYERGLIRHGYNEQNRKWLIAIRHQIFTLREIQQLLDNGQMDRAGAERAFLDMGFDAGKSMQLAAMEFTLHLRRHEHLIDGYTPANIAYMYARGSMSSAGVIFWMAKLDYSDADSSRLMEQVLDHNRAEQARKWANKAETAYIALTEKQYKEAVITPLLAEQALMSQGALADAARTIVTVWEEEVKFSYLTSAIAAVKKGWDTGLLSSVGAEQALLQVGVGLRSAQQRVREWLVNRSVSQNVTGASETLRFVSEGMISPIEGATRLHNMGWFPADADVLIQEALNKLRATEARHLAASDKQVQAQAKAAAALVRQAEAARKAGQSALKRLTPVGTLNKWLKEGLIGTDLYTQRMADMGYPEEEINVYIADISQSKGANIVETGPVESLGEPDSGGTDETGGAGQ